jgi:hypothetical protein
MYTLHDANSRHAIWGHFCPKNPPEKLCNISIRNLQQRNATTG